MASPSPGRNIGRSPPCHLYSARIGCGPGLHAATTSGLSFALGPLINWTFPDIAAAKARIREARAGADERLAAFDGSILTALNETERALTAYATEVDRNVRLRAAVTRQTNATDIAIASARLGATHPRCRAGRHPVHR